MKQKSLAQLNRAAASEACREAPPWMCLNADDRAALRRPSPDQRVATGFMCRLDAMPVDCVVVWTRQDPPAWTPSRSWFYAAARKLSLKLRTIHLPDRVIVVRIA